MRRASLFILLVLSSCGPTAPPPEPSGALTHSPGTWVTGSDEEPEARTIVIDVDAPAETEASTSCSSDRECEVVSLGCGEAVAVHESEAAARRANARGVVCSAPHLDESYSAACVEGVCRARAPLRACEANTDCDVVVEACDQIEVVNPALAASAIAALGVPPALACDGPRVGAIAPRCAGGTCEGLALGNEALRDGCESAAECVVIRGVCNSWLVVHDHQRRDAERRIRADATGQACNRGALPPRPEARCVNRYCVPQ